MKIIRIKNEHLLHYSYHSNSLHTLPSIFIFLHSILVEHNLICELIKLAPFELRIKQMR